MSHFVNVHESRNYYPFLVDYVFSKDTFSPDSLLILISECAIRQLRKDASKKSATDAIESLLEKIKGGMGDKKPGGINALSPQTIAKFISGEEIQIPISFTNIGLGLKRFGHCAGVRTFDSRESVHESAMEYIEQILAERAAAGGPQFLHRFIITRNIDTARWQAYGSSVIDVDAELASTARYVPDVDWRNDADALTGALFEDYIKHGSADTDYGGVIIGRYHDIPVYARVLFGGKGRDATWRRGSVERKESALSFDLNSSEFPLVRYVIRSADENNMFKKARTDINYEREQGCHDRLVNILRNGFSARSLKETIIQNPDWIEWKLASPAAATAQAQG